MSDLGVPAHWSTLWSREGSYAAEFKRRLRCFEKIEYARCHMGVPFGREGPILDAGCGNGHAVVLMRLLYGVEAVGVDWSREAIEAARAYAQGLQVDASFEVSDVRQLPFADATFSGVTSFGVIEHFRDSHLAVDETYRVLRPGGWALFVQPNLLSPVPVSRLVMQMRGSWPFGYQKEFTAGSMRRMLVRAGFSGIRVEAEGLGHSFAPWLDRAIRAVLPHWGWYLFVVGRKPE